MTPYELAEVFNDWFFRVYDRHYNPRNPNDASQWLTFYCSQLAALVSYR